MENTAAALFYSPTEHKEGVRCLLNPQTTSLEQSNTRTADARRHTPTRTHSSTQTAGPMCVHTANFEIAFLKIDGR